MFDYKEYPDSREILEFCIRNYVFIYFFGIIAIVYWITEFKNRQVSILFVSCFLLVLYMCILYRNNTYNKVIYK